jgi:hypothetical protein
MLLLAELKKNRKVGILKFYRLSDYGTPFDRHIIIQDSHETKAKKKSAAKLDEPSSAAGGFGGLFRRLSRRDREMRAAREAAGLPVSAYYKAVR